MTRFIPPLPPDPGLPGAGGLLDGDGAGALESFLSARGWELEDARAVQAVYRPGASLIVRYRARARDPSGGTRRPTLCIETRAEPRRSLVPHADFARRYGLADPIEHATPYTVWAFPYDPGLKNLTDAAWGPVARDALSLLGRRPLGVDVRPLNYRARRRAVFRYLCLHGRARFDGGRRVVFAKVMRTDRARRVEAAAAIAGRRGTGVRLSLPIGNASKNVMLFEPLPGRSLGDLLMRGGRLPAPERICELVSALGRIKGIDAPSQRHRRSPEEVASRTADLVERLAPEVSAEAGAVVDAVVRGAGRDDMPRTVVHGDLYEAQIFVDVDFSLGLIDLDDMGIGDPALDAANFCAHLLALAMTLPAQKDRILAYRTILKSAFLDALDVAPSAFAWREALVMLQLATGPFRMLHHDWPERVASGVRVAARLAGGS